MTMNNVVFGQWAHSVYTSSVSTRVSNALLVGEHRPCPTLSLSDTVAGAIIGQLSVGVRSSRSGLASRDAEVTGSSCAT